MPHVKNDLILELEDACGMGPTRVARLIGSAYPTYAAYRSGTRELPLYHQRHIECLLLLPQPILFNLIEKHIHGDETQTR